MVLWRSSVHGFRNFIVAKNRDSAGLDQFMSIRSQNFISKKFDELAQRDLMRKGGQKPVFGAGHALNTFWTLAVDKDRLFAIRDRAKQVRLKTLVRVVGPYLDFQEVVLHRSPHIYQTCRSYNPRFFRGGKRFLDMFLKSVICLRSVRESSSNSREALASRLDVSLKLIDREARVGRVVDSCIGLLYRATQEVRIAAKCVVI